MKKCLVFLFAVSFLVSCGTASKSTNKKEETKEQEKPKAAPVQEDLEEM